jgi:hypothetical protein
MSFAIAKALATHIFRTPGQVGFALALETFTLIYKPGDGRGFWRLAIFGSFDLGGILARLLQSKNGVEPAQVFCGAGHRVGRGSVRMTKWGNMRSFASLRDHNSWGWLKRFCFRYNSETQIHAMRP